MDFDLDNIDIDSLPESVKWEIIDLLEERERVIMYNQVDKFKPYPFQKEFYAASKKYKRRFLCAANRRHQHGVCRVTKEIRS